MIQTLLESLQKKGYETHVFDTAEEAGAYLAEVLRGTKVGFGGSETIASLGLYERLQNKAEVLWHWRPPQGVDPSEVRRLAAECPVYVSSVNAVSAQGELVNIDGTANRVAAYLYGKEAVYFVFGENKLMPNLEAAIHRARNVAAPKNAKKMGLPTPCAAEGNRCYDCQSPARICRTLNVLWEKPTGARMVAILVREELGF